MRLVLLWAALFFSVIWKGGTQRRLGATEVWTINLRKDLTAEAGLCIVIPCSFTHPSFYKPHVAIWYKCPPHPSEFCATDKVLHSQNGAEVQVEFKNRVALLETDMTRRNCSIAISDLTEGDSGSYQFRVETKNGKGNGYTFQHKTKVTVTALSQQPIMSCPPLTEGQQTTLTCTAPGNCAGTPPKITWTWKGTEDNVTGRRTENVIRVNESHGANLTLTPSMEHHRANITCQVTFVGGATTEKTVTLTVLHIKGMHISGNSSVEEGNPLHLTCQVSGSEPLPQFSVVWRKDGSTISHHDNTVLPTHTIPKDTATDSGEHQDTNNPRDSDNDWTMTTEEEETQNVHSSPDVYPASSLTLPSSRNNSHLTDIRGTALIIHNVKKEDSGEYNCAVKHGNKTITASLNVTVMYSPVILNDSGCVIQADVLTCVCLSLGFPLPNIRWPQLKNSVMYSMIITNNVSSSLVNSTVTLVVRDRVITTIDCISRNDVNKDSRKLTVMRREAAQQNAQGFLLENLKVIIAFLIGATLSAIICCCIRTCYGCKKRDLKKSRSAETLKMVACEYQQVDPGQQARGCHLSSQREMPEGRDSGEAAQAREAARSSGPADESTEVDYANIDYSLLKKRSPRVSRGEEREETKETEYAEIKCEGQQVAMNGGEEQTRIVEDDEREEDEGEAMVVEDEEQEDNKSEQEVSEEETALYSNVETVLGVQHV